MSSYPVLGRLHPIKYQYQFVVIFKDQQQHTPSMYTENYNKVSQGELPA